MSLGNATCWSSHLCIPRSPRAILDKSQRVVVVLVGMAKGSFEEDVVAKATAAFEAESEDLPPPGSAYTTGRFHAVFTGISHGGGTPVGLLGTCGGLS